MNIQTLKIISTLIIIFVLMPVYLLLLWGLGFAGAFGYGYVTKLGVPVFIFLFFIMFINIYKLWRTEEEKKILKLLNAPVILVVVIFVYLLCLNSLWRIEASIRGIKLLSDKPSVCKRIPEKDKDCSFTDGQYYLCDDGKSFQCR